jgi:hypothetical protein
VSTSLENALKTNCDPATVARSGNPMAQKATGIRIPAADADTAGHQSGYL